MADTKYDVETLSKMVGEHGGKPPQLTLNCTIPGKPMGQRTTVCNGQYVGVNFGEAWNEQAFEGVLSILKESPQKRKRTRQTSIDLSETRMNKHTTEGEQDEGNS